MIGQLYDRWVDRVWAQPWRAALWLTIFCLPTLVLTTRFFGNIKAGFEELLPPTAPAVVSIKQLHEVMGGKSHVTVIATSSDADANRAFISELGKRLEAEQLPEIRFLQYDVNPDRDWALRRAPLLMPQADFDAMIAEAQTAVDAAKARANPLAIDVGEEASPPPPDWAHIETLVREKLARYDRFPRGYLEMPDGHTVVAVLWLRGSEVDFEPASKLLSEVKAEVARVQPKYPAVNVAYNGEVPDMIEEHQAILADLSLSSAVVFLLVGGVIALYFRSLRAVVAVVLSIVPGLVITFGLGRLSVGGLNSNTAFLGSIIAGNGINYPLVLLAYFRQQPASVAPPRAFAIASRQGLAGTLGAAVTSSAAYGGLALSDFRGFSQFGWLGVIGMVTVWICSFATLPVTVALLKPARKPPENSVAWRGLVGLFSRPWLSATVAGLVVAGALVGVGLGVRSGRREGVYEMDLTAMRNRDSLSHGSASWDGRMNQLFGVWLNPVVGWVADPAQREALAQKLRQALESGPLPAAERVETIATYAPPMADQEARLARLRPLAHNYRRIAHDQIPADLRPLLDGWFKPESLAPIAVEEVPESYKQPFQEDSGRVDRVVLVYPSLKVNYQDGRNIIHFADLLKDVQFQRGAVVGGGFLFMAEVLRLVRDQALELVGLVCSLVALALIPVLWRTPPWRIPLTLLTTVAVAFGSQAIMLALGVRVNLLNFAAIPITIGVGVDYVVNLFGAADALRVDLRGACVRMGGAIFLCSLTTVIGYFSLVLAQSGALRTFGWSAILGEVLAVSTVLLIYPAVGSWISGRRGSRDALGVAGVGQELSK